MVWPESIAKLFSSAATRQPLIRTNGYSSSMTSCWARLEKTACGNQQLMTELISVFLRESIRLRDALRESIPEKEVRATRVAAHTLKGAALAIGAVPLCEVTAILENKAREQHLDGAHKDLERIELVLEKTIEAAQQGAPS